jgi:hypothetical protein
MSQSDSKSLLAQAYALKDRLRELVEAEFLAHLKELDRSTEGSAAPDLLNVRSVNTASHANAIVELRQYSKMSPIRPGFSPVERKMFGVAALDGSGSGGGPEASLAALPGFDFEGKSYKMHADSEGVVFVEGIFEFGWTVIVLDEEVHALEPVASNASQLKCVDLFQADYEAFVLHGKGSVKFRGV